MSDAESSAAPRRSQRERKQASQFVSLDSSQLSKRKRSEAGSDDEQPNAEPPETDDEEADGEGDYTAPKSSQPRTKKQTEKDPAATPVAQPAAKRGRGRPPGTGKPRAPKVTATTGAKPRRGRPRKGAGEFNADQVARDTKISNDNPLFNAIMNPSAALQSTAEDFLESLSHTPNASLAELLTGIMRACGCNEPISEDSAVDYDRVVDGLDYITEALKQNDTPIYPLTSKLPAFKHFRSSLSEFLSRLIASAAALGQLYTTDLVMTLSTWVLAMSSSPLRSFRHTATVVALEIQTALCEAAASVEKEAEMLSRQKEGERKRKKGKGEPTTARERELESKAKEVRERRSKLSEFIKDFVDGVFVNRYRDTDPNIRAECVHAMGLWFAKYPAYFLDGSHLRYVGWVLSDANTHVRLEAVKALSLAYAQTEYIGASGLQHFTERFKPRLVEMAMSDTELSVRVAVVQVLHAIDENGLLEDEQRERLCLLVFDEENKMRRAVGRFVKGVWQESVEERLVGRKPSAKDKKRADTKAIAMLLVQWGRALDKGKGLRDEDDMDDDGDQSEGSTKQARRKEMVTLVGPNQKGRTALAVEALWEDVDPVRDWETILDVLLLDHSAAGEEGSTPNAKRRGKRPTDDAGVDEVWRLEDVEEGVLLEVLLAALRRTIAEVAGSKKGEDETVSSDITRTLIKGLPRLFVKYQTDAGRMSDVLLLLQVMNLDTYLEMRMMTAYSNLWDDVTKQFTSHSAPIVLTNAVAAIRYMMNATSLSNTNSTKILELEEELSTTLRDAIKGRDELEVASFSEDEVISLCAICARLTTLAGTRDLTAWMEEDEDGKQSSAWDIISALAERGRLGYREEETMIDHALNLLTLYVIWKARGLTHAVEPAAEEAQLRERLKECRDSLLEKLLEFAIGTQSNTADGVKRAAFQNLMNLHILFAPSQPDADDANIPPTASLALTLDEEVQFRCAGFVQAEIERYAEDMEELSPAPSDASENESDNSRSGSERPKGKKKAKGRQPKPDAKHPGTSRSSLEGEYIFMGVVTTFLRAIRAGAVHFQHSATLLAHYGRLGPSFDVCAKVVVEILREEGLYKNNGAAVVAVVNQALRDSFQLFLDGIVRSEDNTIALAKVLSAAFMLRGAQLMVVRRIDSQHMITFHTTSITWLLKRISAYDSASNKKAKNKMIIFFKCLSSLLGSVDARSSLQIKAHLEQTLAQTKVEVPATSKLWDPYRVYEKRLTNSKDKGAKGSKTSRKGAKTADMVTTDEEEAEVEEVEGLMGTDEEAAAPPKPKPRPRGRPRKDAYPVEAGTDGEGMHPATPSAKPRPRPVRKPQTPEPPSRSPTRSPSSVHMRTPTRSPSLSQPPTTPEPEQDPGTDVDATPVASRKRARSVEAPEEPEVVSPQPQDDPSSPNASQEIHTEEIVVRRKRVRH